MPQLKFQLTINRKNLPKMLVIGVFGGIILGLPIAVFRHPVMVWLHHGVWCADVNSKAEVQAVHYGSDCD